MSPPGFDAQDAGRREFPTVRFARRDLLAPYVWGAWEPFAPEPVRIDAVTPPNLAELAQAAARGDAASFAALVRVASPRLLVLAARILADPDEAADVLQEAWMRTHDALATRELRELAAFEAWMKRMVVRLSVDQLRNRARRVRLQGQLEARVAPADEGALEARAACRELASWLEALPAEQRAALVLKDLEGYTSAEIASLMGTSEGSVEQRLVRARATLRERGRREH
ncbi:MAG: RNA polymerase sigma factor [Deltaproteobacteria bacterium]|nr:RNA polymerase sigma factor [Deltaproteobacteria bacterium]